VPSLFGLALPDTIDMDVEQGWIVTGYWRVVWLFCLVVMLIQMLLIQLFFNYETPLDLKAQGRWDELSALMRSMYQPAAVQRRVSEIPSQNKNDDESEVEQEKQTKAQAICDPRYSRATMVGCALSMFQQLSGINVIIFYSSTIFENVGVPGAKGAVYVNTANFLGTCLSPVFVNNYGRKTLMVFWSSVMSLFMILTGVAYI
jgi:hypothetical protein